MWNQPQMGMNEPWVCFVQCWRGKVSHPDLYFSLVVTDNSSTTREESLFWEASFMLHRTWKSTNLLSVFDNTLKIMLCCLGSFWKQGPNVSLEEISCVLHLCLVDLTVCMELVVVAVHREHHSQSSFSVLKWWKSRAGREFTNSSHRPYSNFSSRSNFVLVWSSSLSFLMFNSYVWFLEFPFFLLLSPQVPLHHSIYHLYDGNCILQPRIFVWTWQTRFTLQNRLWSEIVWIYHILLQTNPILIYFGC